MIKTTPTLHWLSRLLIFALALMLLIGAGFPTPTHAQNDAETVWYWATTPEGLVAYNPAGEINLLLANPDFYTSIVGGFRTSWQTALVWDSSTFYQVSQYGVLQTYPMISLFWEYDTITYRHPYMILSSAEPPKPGYVLNIETSEAKQLSGGDLLWRPVMMADGHTLRYVSTDPSPHPDHDGVYSLRELDLETWQEKVLLVDDANDGYLPNVIHSPDGEQWWMASDYDRENDVIRQMQTFGVTDHQYTDWFQQNHAFVKYGQIWLFNIPCVDDCSVDVYSLFDNTPPFSIQLPTMLVTPNSDLQFYIHGIYHFADDSIILNAYVDGIISDIVSWLWIPSLNGRDGEWIELGRCMFYEGANNHVWDSENFSKDGRWALTLNRADDGIVSAQLWRLSHREVVVDIPLTEFQSVTWRHLGETVIIYVMDGQAQLVQTVILQGIGNGPYYFDANWKFFEILPDGSVLVTHFPHTPKTGGIYRLGTENNPDRLLVPMGKPISLYNQMGAE